MEQRNNMKRRDVEQCVMEPHNMDQRVMEPHDENSATWKSMT